MKKILLCVAIALGAYSASFAQSETFKAFKLEFGVGAASPAESGITSGGVILSMEPKYAINDKLTFGILLETTGREKKNMTVERTWDTDLTTSYLLTGDYYFNTNGLRPFAGIGAGIHRIGIVDLSEATSNDYEAVKVESALGLSPRIGFETSHFRLSLSYNYASQKQNYNYSYIGLKTGFFFGGGRK